jgi:excisionase family DNA binding protein
MGCNEKTIRRRIAEGELPAFRMGKRSIRIKESDLLDLMRPIPTAHAS